MSRERRRRGGTPGSPRVQAADARRWESVQAADTRAWACHRCDHACFLGESPGRASETGAFDYHAVGRVIARCRAIFSAKDQVGTQEIVRREHPALGRAWGTLGAMTRPVCDQRSRDLLEDRGLVFDDDQDPAPTSLGSQRGPWPHYTVLGLSRTLPELTACRSACPCAPTRVGERLGPPMLVRSLPGPASCRIFTPTALTG